MTSIENASRMQIAEFLPDAIAKAITSYRLYMQSKDSTDAGDFKEMHTAGKSAIAHIELLLKLARWADLPDQGAKDVNNTMILEAIIIEAEEELEDHRRRLILVEE